ncbi:hypothetical protein SAMN05216188_11285 [Lentzea xinjiangensis]|uniref:Uncharacterized protein n=1 Tax=Lentzea xinjiangensis TaxID=402600 RepID=A0A1H9PUA6_9PSEU|nr:hypothetical protein [Lentzea xinjiangensis]SER51866.1 hypothetical protein SAMN05216188_11285 [Lentzea xinjiangensis]
MAGAVGIVFGLCVLSFTIGAALMYVLVRRREDRAAAPSPSTGSAEPGPDAPAQRAWVGKPVVVEPVDDDYDTRPIHRNPVVGLAQLEPALTPAEPVGEPAGPGDTAAGVPGAEVVGPAGAVGAVGAAEVPDALEAAEAVGEAALPPPAPPRPAERATWVEREDFRERYLRTFDEVRRKAGSN